MHRNIPRLAIGSLLGVVMAALAADGGKPTVRWAQVAILPPGTNDPRQTEVVTPPASDVPPADPSAPSAIPTPAGAAPGAPATVAPGVVLPGGGPVSGTGTAPGAVSTSVGSSAALPPGCAVTLANPSAAVGHEGGVVRLGARFTPADCAREPVSSVGWIRRMEGDPQAGFPFNVEPNPTRTDRVGTLRIGNAVFTVRQEGAKFAAFAAAPARLEFAVGQKKGGAKQAIVAWSDDPNVTYAATVVPPVAWLKLVPESRKAGKQKFVVEVAAEELKPGKQEAVVEISSPGSVAPSIRIPVTAVAEERKK